MSGWTKNRLSFDSGDQPAEAGKERSIRGSQSRTGHLPSEDRHLVPEHDDLDGQIGVVGPLQAEDLDGPKEGEIEEREGHGPFSRSHLLWRKAQFNVPDEVLGSYTPTPATRTTARLASSEADRL